MQQPRPRSGIIVGLLSLGLLVGVALTASPAQAATSNGPYYAEPAWDQKLPAATRFIILTDWNSEAVLDRETGLVWEKSPLTTVHPWDLTGGILASARGQCTSRTTGERKGWRLPSVHELVSLVDPSQTNPSLPLGHPFTNVQTGYWSATTIADVPTVAWYVRFDTGDMPGLAKSGTLRAWCVRGGMNADAY